MANHVSSLKRARQTERKTAVNRANKSKLRGSLRELRESLATGDATAAAEQFKAIVNEVKTETGAKGKELFHPIRIVITGSHSGPEFDKLIPILEEGSRLKLPKHVLSVRERVDAFLSVYNPQQ